MKNLRSYRRFIAALSLGLVVATGGCKSPDDISGPQETTGTLIVVNETSVPVFYLYIKPCSGISWGDDRLGVNEVIAPRANRSWVLAAGCYDVIAEFIDERYAESTVTVQSNASFTLRLVE